MTKYEQVFQNNQKWVREQTALKHDYFEQLAQGQDPEFLFIGCSDSRVPANQIMGLNPGDVFVHRNIANLVCATDLNAMSVIEYAVVHLNVKHIVVCGHYNCGGVKAAMEPKDLGLLNPWLRNIRDVYRAHKDELNAITDEEVRYRRLVELNVESQCENIIKLACVQKAFIEDHYPYVHAWVFDLKTGLINDLKLNYEEKLKEVREVYNLMGDL